MQKVGPFASGQKGREGEVGLLFHFGARARVKRRMRAFAAAAQDDGQAVMQTNRGHLQSSSSSLRRFFSSSARNGRTRRLTFPVSTFPLPELHVPCKLVTLLALVRSPCATASSRAAEVASRVVRRRNIFPRMGVGVGVRGREREVDRWGCPISSCNRCWSKPSKKVQV